MNPLLQRILIEKTGNDNGFEHVLLSDASGVRLASARHANRAWVGLEDGIYRVRFQTASQSLLPELQRSFPATDIASGEIVVASEADLAALLRRAASLSRALPSQAANDYQQAVAAELAQLPAGMAGTEVERMVRQRVGQNKFREAMLDYWGGACAVTGVAIPAVLRASHAKAWAACESDAERLDVFNPGPVGNSLSFSGDTLAPTLTITSDKASLKAGDTATVRFSFAELPQGFTQSDIETSNGSLSNLQADSSGLLYTATFTPTANVAGNDAVIRVGVGSYTDAAGNPGQASTPLNISLDTRLPGISLSGVTVNEGQAGTSPVLITVNLSMTPIQPVSVNYATVDGTAVAGSDYTATSGTLTFQPGETSKTIPIAVIGDATAENDENFQVQLSAATNAMLGSSAATVILGNDDQPTLSLSGTSLSEGNFGSSTASVTVSLSTASNKTVSVNYATVDGTAFAGSDYTATSGTLTFQPGETSKTIPIAVIGDTTVENDENFQVQMRNPQNASLNSTTRSALIDLLNDDVAPVSSYTKGQAVIDLGSQYGKLIKPVQVDGGHFFYYWDISGDGTSASKKGAGYANSVDFVTHDWLDKIFQQDVNGRVEGENGAPIVRGDGDTDNTYRFATLNGVKLALPTIGNGDDFISSGETGYRNGTAVSGTASNPTYDDYLAIWDAYNGTGTGTRMDGTSAGWDGRFYWSATPSASDLAIVSLKYGFVSNNSGLDTYYVAVEVW